MKWLTLPIPLLTSPLKGEEKYYPPLQGEGKGTRCKRLRCTWGWGGRLISNEAEDRTGFPRIKYPVSSTGQAKAGLIKCGMTEFKVFDTPLLAAG